MTLNERMENGSMMAMISFNILKKEKNLLLFPILSTLSLFMILGSFAAGIFTKLGFEFSFIRFPFVTINNVSETTQYILLFFFYLFHYFIIIFFNMALIHCTIQYFNGKKTSLKEGLLFSISKLSVIFSWALLSATIGFGLRLIEDKGKSLTTFVFGLLGFLWSLMTFFVIPVIAYENLNMKQAIKRSKELFKDTWGERYGAAWTFIYVTVIIFFVIVIPLAIMLDNKNVDHNIIFGIILALLIPLTTVTAAAEGIFKAAVYQYAIGKSTGEFDKKKLKSAFVKLQKKSISDKKSYN